jgi:hypothetical protein
VREDLPEGIAGGLGYLDVHIDKIRKDRRLRKANLYGPVRNLNLWSHFLDPLPTDADRYVLSGFVPRPINQATRVNGHGSGAVDRRNPLSRQRRGKQPEEAKGEKGNEELGSRRGPFRRLR